SRVHSKVYVAHVGDSRCYRVRDGEITLLTRDHSLLNDYLLVMPDMTQEQKDELPKNVITRALGMQDTVVVDLVPEAPQAGDRYLLCSDGLSGMVSDEEMLEAIAEAGPDIEGAVQRLVDLANRAGGEDNITVVIVGVTETEDVGRASTQSPPSADETAPHRAIEDEEA
ncbi:MAG: serine/threonine-protein phosphatase, partial [Myxococcota bacterium]